MDRYICVEEILPLFRSMKTRDQRILMKSLRLFEIVPQLVTDDVTLVEQLLPLLWNYSMASTLKASEYSEFVKVINKLTRDIPNAAPQDVKRHQRFRRFRRKECV